jgi:5-methylcytosine-specific restriction endonuclease McrA
VEAIKQCVGCGETKPVSAFHKQKQQPDGYRPRCKVCRKPETEAWYQKYKEGIKARSKAWRETHREQYAKMMRDWRAKNRDYKRRLDQKYYADHTEERKEYGQRPEVRVRARQSAKNQKAKRKLAMGAAHHPITAAEWLQIKADYSSLCAYCNARETPEESLTQDHVIPLNKGGSHTADNIVPACGECNTTKQTMSLVEFLLYARKKREK